MICSVVNIPGGLKRVIEKALEATEKTEKNFRLCMSRSKSFYLTSFTGSSENEQY